MKILKIMSASLVLFSYTFADTSIHTEKVHYLDTLHADISKKVLDLSTYADITISSWLGYTDVNTTCIVDRSLNSVKSKHVDSFFQNDKYIDETENIFIRLRVDTNMETRESNKLRLKFRAQLPFSRCRQQLKIFVEDMSLSNTKQNIKNEDRSTDIGLRYVGKERHGIKSRYSVGLSGLSPFISARYRYPLKVNSWEIDPIQTFKYSSKDYFIEETNIYFDRYFSTDKLFRLTLQRGTESKIEGMDYGLKVDYYMNAKDNKGLRFSQAFYGNTNYRHRKKEHRINHPVTEYSGIHNYVTSMSYRANIWRKWFYYEITPTVNFHKDHDYKPNYSLRFFFDFYFGEYNLIR